MKNLPFPRRLIVLAVALLMSTTTFAQCPASKDMLADFPEELPIKVDQRPYRITRDQINTKKAFFQDRIHYTENQNPNPTPMQIDAIDVIDSLYCNAEKLRRSLNIPANTYVTGVWIIIGIENNDISYSFQPAVLELIEKKQKLRTFISRARGHIYSYINNKFERESDTDCERKQKLYFDSVRIKHTDKGNFEAGVFRRPDGSLESGVIGDAREIFYSFQEILGFYSEHIEEIPREFYSGAIYLNHSAANFAPVPKGSNPWRAKHTIFITVGTKDSINTKAAITPAAGIKNRDPGTNLAHVCPSVCNKLQYTEGDRAENAGTQRIKKTKN